MAWDILIELRKNRDMSQEELADKIGVSQKSISKYEKQDVRPSWEAMINIANLFNVSIDYLLGRVSDPQQISSTVSSPTPMQPLSENASMLLENFEKLCKEDQIYILGKTIELVREQKKAEADAPALKKVN